GQAQVPDDHMIKDRPVAIGERLEHRGERQRFGADGDMDGKQQRREGEQYRYARGIGHQPAGADRGCRRAHATRTDALRRACAPSGTQTRCPVSASRTTWASRSNTSLSRWAVKIASGAPAQTILPSFIITR